MNVLKMCNLKNFPQGGGVYIIKFPGKENIYKIGRSNNIYNRVNNYENGTIVYLIIECNNSENNERVLIDVFNKKFKKIKYYGNEYFQGDLFIMKTTIIDYIKNNTTKLR